jgi:hypothetical protein
VIEVVYNPQYEKYKNYVSTILPLRYDVFLFIDETHAIHPLHMPNIDDTRFSSNVFYWSIGKSWINHR